MAHVKYFFYFLLTSFWIIDRGLPPMAMVLPLRFAASYAPYGRLQAVTNGHILRTVFRGFHSVEGARFTPRLNSNYH